MVSIWLSAAVKLRMVPAARSRRPMSRFVDGKIASVGNIAESGREEIDARGLLVTPGFVDIHTHYDGQATWDRAPAAFELARRDDGRHGQLRRGLRARAQIRSQPPDRIDGRRGGHTGRRPARRSRLELGILRRLSRCGRKSTRTTSISARSCRMARSGSMSWASAARTSKPPPKPTSPRCARLAADAMRAGALGFSTSRTLNHRTVKGDPTPSLRATEAELTGIAQGPGRRRQRRHRADLRFRHARSRHANSP